MKAIQGMFPPIVTAFKANGDIDEPLVAAEMDFALRAGVQGLSVAGSTGEGPTLCDEELRDMVQLARERAGDERPVICGVMRGCTRGCRFCQAGMLYRPVRERSVDKLVELAKESVKNTGYE